MTNGAGSAEFGVKKPCRKQGSSQGQAALNYVPPAEQNTLPHAWEMELFRSPRGSPRAAEARGYRPISDGVTLTILRLQLDHVESSQEIASEGGLRTH
jgi:hypothetical protein